MDISYWKDKLEKFESRYEFLIKIKDDPAMRHVKDTDNAYKVGLPIEFYLSVETLQRDIEYELIQDGFNRRTYAQNMSNEEISEYFKTIESLESLRNKVIALRKEN